MDPSGKPIKIIGVGKYAIDAIDCIDKKLLSGAEFIAISASHAEFAFALDRSNAASLC